MPATFKTMYEHFAHQAKATSKLRHITLTRSTKVLNLAAAAKISRCGQYIIISHIGSFVGKSFT